MYKYLKCTRFEYILNTYAVVHTEIEYILLNIGTLRRVFYVYSVGLRYGWGYG